MKTSTFLPSGKPINVMLIGNNPIELGRVYDKLKKSTTVKYITDISFNISDAMLKILPFQPNLILVDDNLSKKNIQKLAKNIARDERTKDIPITLLKTSNYNEIISTGIQDFLMKDGFSADKLYRSILNVLKFRRTHIYLYKTYKRAKVNFQK